MRQRMTYLNINEDPRARACPTAHLENVVAVWMELSVYAETNRLSDLCQSVFRELRRQGERVDTTMQTECLFGCTETGAHPSAEVSSLPKKCLFRASGIDPTIFVSDRSSRTRVLKSIIKGMS